MYLDFLVIFIIARPLQIGRGPCYRGGTVNLSKSRITLMKAL